MQFSAAGESLKKKNVWKSLIDWKTWVSSTVAYFLRDADVDALSISPSGNLHGTVRLRCACRKPFLVPDLLAPVMDLYTRFRCLRPQLSSRQVLIYVRQR
jgi:hypothetical protein